MMSYDELDKLGIVITNRGSGVYVGRGSVLGNKFREGVDGTRDQVIAMYRVWMWNQLQGESEVNDEINRLYKLWVEHGEVKLNCFCRPKACHGQVLGSALVWMRDRNEHVA
jgi:hypothetical protein